MAQIELLQVGCSGQQLLDAINALIAAHNSGESGIVVSYEDLTDLPTINGVLIKGDLTTATAKIKTMETMDYDTIQNTYATKSYADTAKTEALSAAEAAVAEALDSKLDKDLGNIDAVDYFDKESQLLIVTKGGVKKTTLNRVAAFTKVENETALSAVETALSKERKTLTLEGEKDGTNKVYTVVEGYKPGTGMLYFNGQLLAPDDDYEETDSSTITFIHIAPESEDKLIFRAVPAT
jgi:hypothetical protein